MNKYNVRSNNDENYINTTTGEVENLEDKYGFLTVMLYKVARNIPLDRALVDELKLKKY